MAGLEAARQRVDAALAQLEGAAQRFAARGSDGSAASAAPGEGEELRAEVDRLRRELDALQGRNAELLASAGEAEERLGQTIRHLDHLAGG